MIETGVYSTFVILSLVLIDLGDEDTELDDTQKIINVMVVKIQVVASTVDQQKVMARIILYSMLEIVLVIYYYDVIMSYGDHQHLPNCQSCDYLGS